MVYIPPGKFLMGDDDLVDNQRHTVHLSGYWISRTVVTVEQYMKYCDQGGKRPKPPSFNPDWVHTDHPIVNVSWNDAQSFCKWAGLQLPTEAQWEKAARGTDGRKYPWGNDPPDPSKLWYESVPGTCSATRFKQGPYGLYDMAGNVWQWCNDSYDPDFWTKRPTGEVNTANKANGRLRLVRGASWNYGLETDFRAAYRGPIKPESRNDDLGFRVCLEGSR